MIDREAISSLLTQLITTLTTELSIVANQNAPRPADVPYSTIHMFNGLGIGWDEVTLTDQVATLDIDETIEGTRQLSFSLNFFRDNATTTAMRVRTLFQSSLSHAFFTANGLGLGRRSNVRILDEEVSANWEERAQLDVDFFVVDIETLVIRSIQSLEIDGEAHIPGQKIDFTFDVP